MKAEDSVAELPDPPLYIVCAGRKGQGKSELAYLLWDSWEGDRILIDTTGTVGRLHPEEETLDLVSGEPSTRRGPDVPSGPAPDRFPSWMRTDGERLSLRYVPDHTDPDVVDEVDRVIGLAFSQGDLLLWIEEAGLFGKANRVPPHYTAANHMGRHKNLTKIETMPRLMDVDPLIPAQADIIYAFDLPSPSDRKRFADVAGFDQRTIDDAIAELEDHEYIRYHAKAHELAHFPPIPLPKRRRRVAAHMEDEDPT